MEQDGNENMESKSGFQRLAVNVVEDTVSDVDQSKMKGYRYLSVGPN